MGSPIKPTLREAPTTPPTDRELVARFVNVGLAKIGDPPVRPDTVTQGMLIAYRQDVEAYRASHPEDED